MHQSTYGRNRLSMAAGVATLRIIERDRLVEHAARMSAVLLDGLAELAQRYEMIKEVRGSGLMIGIELCAPSSRVARVNWRLIHMASEGLFPQLIVIPLHRDHGVITMAAGKNDVIKLLPPLTLSEAEARSFLGALDAVLADCHGAASKNWGVVRDIATATLKRRATPEQPVVERGAVPRQARRSRRRATSAWSRARPGSSAGASRSGWSGEGYQVRCLVRPSSDTSRLDELDVEIAVGDLTKKRSLTRAAEGCHYVFHCGARVSDWGTTEEIARTNVQGTRNLLEACVAASVQRVDPFQHHGCLRLSRSRERSTRHTSRRGFETGTRRRSWLPRPRFAARKGPTSSTRSSCARRPSTAPARPTSSARSRGAMRSGNMLLVDRGRAIAGLCYVDNLIDAAILALRHEAAPGNAFNVSDGLDVTWKEFTDGLAKGLGYSQVRWSMPYWMANAIGFSLEHGYRLLRRTTRLSTQPLLSRQAVQMLGTDQDFSNRKAREVLGWEPRVDYEAGLEATVAWLHAERLSH